MVVLIPKQKEEKMKEIFKNLFEQEEKLPKGVKDKFEHEESILLYAFADLDRFGKLSESWTVLTENSLFIYEKEDTRYELVNFFDLKKVKRIVERQGVSAFQLNFLRDDKDAPLACIYYSHRQKIALGHVKYFVEQVIENNTHFIDLIKGKDKDEVYQESVLKPVSEAKQTNEANKSAVTVRLLKFLRPYKKEMIIGMGGACLTTSFALLPPFISGYIIDDVIKPFQTGSITSDEAMSIAWKFVALLFVAKVMREFFMWVRLKKMSIIGEYVAYDLRKELYTHLQTLDMDFFSKKQTGTIISRVSSDTDRIWDFIAFGIVEVSIALLTLIGLSGVLLYLDWQLAMFMVLPVPVFLFAIYLHGERMKKLFLRIWRKWSAVTEVLSDTIPGVQVVKAFAQEKKEVKRFGNRNVAFLDECNELHLSWTRFWPMLTLGIQLTGMGVWVFAMPRLIGVESSLTAGTFVSFLLYMTMFAQPIEIIGQMARMLNRATSSAYRIFEILDTRPSIKKKVDGKKIKVEGDIKYEEVYFSYDGVRPILKGVNFHINAGEMIGLVGASGGGKSTITKLLNRFYDIDSGVIEIDGENISELDVENLRQQVGMVLQEPYLFHGSIAENIAYGNSEASFKEIIEAAKVANAHDFIGKLGSGYETIIGERGHTLSGGERQRISIARAILNDPKILILDEATSAVDTETEHKIQEALERLVEGRTVIAIAHRLSTLRKADRILVVEDGKIVEQGKHADLLNIKEGTYKKLQDMQKVMHEGFVV